MLLRWTLPVDRTRDEWSTQSGSEGTDVARPAADVIDAGTEYRIVVEMPGVAKEGLEIDVEEDVLRLRGRRPATEKTAHVLLNERHADRVLERRFTLGQDIDRDKVRARLDNGLLVVTLARKAEVQPQRIEVEVG